VRSKPALSPASQSIDRISRRARGTGRSHGFEPTDEPNRELFALEPDDIHMILEL